MTTGVFLTTTGTQDPVVIGDMGGLSFAHPTSDHNLYDDVREDEVQSSVDLQALVTAGHVTLADGDGVPITDVTTVGRPSKITARITTTDATADVSVLINGTDPIVIPDGTTWLYDVSLIARQVGGVGGTVGNSAGYVLRGVLKRIGAATSRVGASDKTVLAEDDASWDADADADDVNEALDIQVTGAVDQTINWVAVVRLSQVT